MPDLDPPFIPPPWARPYGKVHLSGGPCDGEHLPTVGCPLFGFCLKVDYWTAKKGKQRTAIYMVTSTGVIAGHALYVGTLR